MTTDREISGIITVYMNRNIMQYRVYNIAYFDYFVKFKYLSTWQICQ